MKKKVVCAFVLGLFVSCTMPIATFGETQENVIAVQTDQNEVENQDNFTGEKLIEGKWHYFLEGKMVTDEFVQLSENRIVLVVWYMARKIYTDHGTILTRFMEVWLEV